MTLRTTLLSAGSALLLSAGVAAAAPAVAQTDLNMRSGPGTQYGVVATIPDGATVDVGGCTGSWCAVNFSGISGYASANYLSGAGSVGPSAGVVVQPGYDTYAYDNTYNDYYDYGPTVGLYATPGFRGGFRNGWHGRSGWNGGNAGNWQRGPGRVGGNFNRGGNFGGARVGGTPRMSAPAGMRTGGAGFGGGGVRGGGGAAISGRGGRAGQGGAPR